LSNGDSDQSYRDIDFALYAYPNTHDLLVYEQGHMRTRVAGYATGDTLKVALESGVVKYYRNAAVIFSSSLTPVYPLLVDDSLNAVNSKLYNVRLGGTTIGLAAASSTGSVIDGHPNCTASFRDVPEATYYYG